MSAPTISVSNASKNYETRDGKMEAISNISFDVRDGEFVSLIGPSGCGKSTLLMMIAGLILPTSGSISIKGRMMTGPNPATIAIMFQDPGLLPWRNLTSNVALGLEVRKAAPKKERDAIAKKYIELVGLSGFERRYPSELSGGMKQRVALARSLSLDTNILLLDEPFGALDEQTRLRMGEELIRILNITSKTIILVTHSLQEAVSLSDRVIVLSNRPAHIRQEINIELARPRKLTDTAPYVEKLWQLLEAS